MDLITQLIIANLQINPLKLSNIRELVRKLN
jgi:hypothetical protein